MLWIDEPGLEHERVRDHRVVVGVGVLLDVEVLLDDRARVLEERPLRADRRAELLARVVLVGRDRGDLGVGDGDLRIERGELEVLLVLLRAVVAAREREDHRIVALQLAERARDARRDRAARSPGTCRRGRCRGAWGEHAVRAPPSRPSMPWSKASPCLHGSRSPIAGSPSVASARAVEKPIEDQGCRPVNSLVRARERNDSFRCGRAPYRSDVR